MFVSRHALTAMLLAGILSLAAGSAQAQPSPCERANTDPAELQDVLSKKDELPEVFRDDNYVALQDKSTWAMWTFTLPAHAAHPAVVCRRPVREGETITLEMVINCKGDEKACGQLETDFRALNSKMAQEMKAKK